MKTYRNKVAIYLRRNSQLIQDSGDKRERGLAKSAAVSLKNVNGRQETLASWSLEKAIIDILLE